MMFYPLSWHPLIQLAHKINLIVNIKKKSFYVGGKEEREGKEEENKKEVENKEAEKKGKKEEKAKRKGEGKGEKSTAGTFCQTLLYITLFNQIFIEHILCQGDIQGAGDK
jgi:hypothetical protein